MNTTLEFKDTTITVNGELTIWPEGIQINTSTGEMISFRNEEIIEKEEKDDYDRFVLSNGKEIIFSYEG